MRLHTAHRRIVSWMAMLAILAAGFAPAVSQAMRGGSARWVEVCTVLGATWMRVDADGAGPASPGSKKPAQAHPAFEHCAYASLFAAGFAPPPALPTAGSPPLRFDVPRSVPALPARPSAWLSAQPRGPPLSLA